MGEIDKSGPAVSSMFARIAGRYDFLNHLLSGNADRRWRRAAASRLNGRHRRVLDLATGTGDLAIALQRRDRSVVGADFCLDMLAIARHKSGTRGLDKPLLSGADALALPFPDHEFDAVTVAFGARNFSDLGAGLAQIFRVLKPGGALVILEFSRPRGLWGALYRFYSNRVLPGIGGLVSGAPGAYTYLNRSVAEWPGKDDFSRALESAGFTGIRATPLALGVVALHEGTRP
jgi:demethylmenaquinone methyltransferase/2-methoxy-6-polyprenyl-1,4-benzoquinol methylase